MKSYYVFLLTLFILLTNCEQEVSLSEETDPSVHATEISSDAPFTIEVIPFSETDNLFGNLNLGSHLYHSDRDVGLKRNSGASGIEIYPGMVKKITGEGYASYTMLIKSPENDLNVFYNLTIEDREGVMGDVCYPI